MTPEQTVQAQALLSDHEMKMLRRLAADRLSAEQIDTVLGLRQRNQTPLLDILGALNLINLNDYAGDLAEVAGTAYASDLIASDAFVHDPDLMRRFNPAVMARHLFCPLQLAGDLLTVLVTDVDNAGYETAIADVLPQVEVVPFVGTERDVKHLLDRVFGPSFLHQAVHHLAETRPDQSAARVVVRRQGLGLALLALISVAGLLIDPWATLAVYVVIISVFYLVSIAFKFGLTLLGAQNRLRRDRRFSAETLAAIPDADLPIYSILVPVYHEPAVVPNLLRALASIDYPHEKLDVLILLEADDEETIAAGKASNPPAFFRFFIVPESLPKTKPKACNYGLNFCRGEFVTIYDAEDIPEPDQLRKAVAAFKRGGDRLACVQSALNYYNANENYLTRMFTLEYTYWFDYMLPGLDRLGLPIPLGGTSNHFRTDMLRELGAWDPYNVTEDADLGIRIAANRYTVGVMSATTFEEANKHVGNWIRQRSRWIKGYMQTWLVHNRHPLRLIRAVGLKGWLGFQLLVGGTVWVFLANPIMWAFFIVWLLADPAWLDRLFFDWVQIIALISLVLGNGIAIGLNILAVLGRRGNRHLVAFALSNPLYWTLHSIAAYKALWQLIRRPFYWEKTTHGLTTFQAHRLTAEGQPAGEQSAGR